MNHRPNSDRRCKPRIPIIFRDFSRITNCSRSAWSVETTLRCWCYLLIRALVPSVVGVGLVVEAVSIGRKPVVSVSGILREVAGVTPRILETAECWRRWKERGSGARCDRFQQKSLRVFAILECPERRFRYPVLPCANIKEQISIISLCSHSKLLPFIQDQVERPRRYWPT